MKRPRLSSARVQVRSAAKRAGSLTRRMIGISAVWILLLLGLGGYTLDRVLTSAITDNFDAQLEYVLTAMIASAEIGPEGEVLFNRALADQRFLEPYSGLYYQISGAGSEPFPSRSLWDGGSQVGGRTTTARSIIYDSERISRGEAAHHRARRPAARLAGALALPGRAEPRRDSTSRSACSAGPWSAPSASSASA